MPQQDTHWPSPVRVKIPATHRVCEIDTSEVAKKVLFKRWAPFVGPMHRKAVKACDASIKGQADPGEAMALFREAAIESGMFVLRS